MNKTHCAHAIAVLLACSLIGCVTGPRPTTSTEKQTETIDLRLFPEGGRDEFRPKSDLVELRSTQYPSENNPEFIIYFQILGTERPGKHIDVTLAFLDKSGKLLYEDTKVHQAPPGSTMRQSFGVDYGIFKQAERARMTFAIQD